MRKSFNFYASYFDVANELKDLDRLSFYDGLIHYELTGDNSKLESLKGMAKFAYISQKHSIESQIKGHVDKSKSLLNKPFTGYICTEKSDPTLGGDIGPILGGDIDPILGGAQQVQVQPTSISKNKSKSVKPTIGIPTLQEFGEYAMLHNNEFDCKLDKSKIRLKYESWKVNDWKDGKDVEIKNWKSKLLNTLQYLCSDQQTTITHNFKSKAL